MGCSWSQDIDAFPVRKFLEWSSAGLHVRVSPTVERRLHQICCKFMNAAHIAVVAAAVQKMRCGHFVLSKWNSFASARLRRKLSPSQMCCLEKHLLYYKHYFIGQCQFHRLHSWNIASCPFKLASVTTADSYHETLSRSQPELPNKVSCILQEQQTSGTLQSVTYGWLERSTTQSTTQTNEYMCLQAVCIHIALITFGAPFLNRCATDQKHKTVSLLQQCLQAIC